MNFQPKNDKWIFTSQGVFCEMPAMVSVKRHVSKFGFMLSWVAIVVTASSPGLSRAASGDEELTAVNSKEFNGYIRAKRPDGSLQPEAYAFGEGGLIPNSLRLRDPTIDDLSFSTIAKMLVGPLAKQNYVITHDADGTNLLIMIFWGMTNGADNTTDGRAQDALNYSNATLLGFDAEARFLRDSDGAGIQGHILREVHAAQMGAVEVNRYYVILRAFDFKSAWKQKTIKLLWETRFSFTERAHGFHQDLPAMADNASLYFGQDSHGLVRPPQGEGRVTLGELKILNTIDKQSDPSAASFGDTAAGIAGDWRGTGPGGRPVIIHVDKTGNATIEKPDQHTIIPARVSVKGGVVTVSISGWGVFFQGMLNGDQMNGTVSEFGVTSSLTLTKMGNPADESRIAPDAAKSPGDVPAKSSPGATVP